MKNANRGLWRFALMLALLGVAFALSVTRGHTGDAVIIGALLAAGAALLRALLYLPHYLAQRSERSGE